MRYRYGFCIWKESGYKFEVLKGLIMRFLGKDFYFEEDMILRSNGFVWNCGKTLEGCVIGCSLYEPKLFNHLNINSGAFVDVGANIGKYAVKIAKLNPEIMVYAFEPDEGSFRLLEENARLNNVGVNLIAFNYALGNEENMKIFYKSKQNPARNSFLPIKDFEEEYVPIVKLDENMKDNVKLIKIDVEGFELDVLKGGIETINRNNPRIIFEANDEDKLNNIRNFLVDYDYIVMPIDETNFMAQRVAEI